MVLFSSLNDNTNFHCEIFNSETLKWKQLRNIVLPYGVFICNYFAIVIGHSIYWLLTNGTILSFNTDTKVYTLFRLLSFEKEVPYFSRKRLIKYKGKLAFIFEEENLMMWIMEDSGRFTWGEGETFS